MWRDQRSGELWDRYWRRKHWLSSKDRYGILLPANSSFDKGFFAPVMESIYFGSETFFVINLVVPSDVTETF